jgi:large subunit ribosomal protein L10
MDKATKQATIEDLTAQFESATNFYLADASGLTVADINKLRRICHKEGIKVRVAKNTFIKKALTANGDKYDSIFEALNGPTSIFFSETANAPAKVIKEFRKTSERPVLKAAYIDTAIYLGDKALDELSKLKSKQELIGEVISLLQSPVTTVLGQLMSAKNKLGGIVQTLGNRPEN